MPDPDTVARLERMGALAGAAELSPDPPMSRG
jgi:hypothetical protein